MQTPQPIEWPKGDELGEFIFGSFQERDVENKPGKPGVRESTEFKMKTESSAQIC